MSILSPILPMLLTRHFSTAMVALGLVSAVSGAFFFPNPQASLLEHILVDTHGAHRSGFADAITPCTNYVSGSQTLGRETAAQWLRVAFHDFVTAHVDEGIGGMDASIGFETLREEDSGSAFNDSFAFFRPYVNSKVSMADLVAISVSVGVGNCGGPQIAVRGGRIDATEAGPFGVPAPDTDLGLTLEYFANSGFNQIDSIGLTACGHTLGSVHHGGFPTVVGPEAVSANNTAGGIHFDSTVAVFDANVVGEYLDSTGNRGGPLVTSFNVSSRSDLRLYESDNNATMIKLRNQGAGFLDICKTLLQRMIETVPKGVFLSDIVSPLSVKPVNASLDFDTQGNTIFVGSIRVYLPSKSPDVILIGIDSHPIVFLPTINNHARHLNRLHTHDFDSGKRSWNQCIRTYNLFSFLREAIRSIIFHLLRDPRQRIHSHIVPRPSRGFRNSISHIDSQWSEHERELYHCRTVWKP